MDNVVNLNKFKKAKAKGDKTQKAAENRKKHGRTKAEKALDKMDADKSQTTHDGNELKNPNSDEPNDPDGNDPA